MKKVLTILLAVIMLVSNSISVQAKSVDNITDLSTLQGLISEGNSITIILAKMRMYGWLKCLILMRNTPLHMFIAI